RHFLKVFAALGVPPTIKTDNGPAYSSQLLKTFFSEWGIRHITGIPHLPTGQSIIEQSHQT
ncbi:POK6 protein, partial [Ramphastos sulfuratus]|nr:POK6 protein [Ramphastos sulfuratus]